MKVLLKCFNNTEFLEGYDYAIVEIDKDLAQTILSRRKRSMAIHSEDSDAYEIEFWDSSVKYYGCGLLETLPDGPESFGLRSHVEGLQEEWMVLQDDFVVDKEAEKVADEGSRTDADRMMISKDGVRWTCYPKYVDTAYVDTGTIPYDIIEKALVSETLRG